MLGSIVGAAGEAERLRTRGRDIGLQTRAAVVFFRVRLFTCARRVAQAQHTQYRSVPGLATAMGMKGKAQKGGRVGKETSPGRRARLRRQLRSQRPQRPGPATGATRTGTPKRRLQPRGLVE